MVYRGEYWGEMGYARVEKGNNALLLEQSCSWAVPKTWTAPEGRMNFPCHEDGGNCNEHEPDPPPQHCYKYCSKKGIAMCTQLGTLIVPHEVLDETRCVGMHCNCGDALYNSTGKGMPHGESCGHKPGCTGQCATRR